MIKYKIIEVNEAEHSIVVRYYTDKITEESLATDILDGVIRRGRTDYSIDLPVPPPLGKKLHDFIIAKAPFDWFNSKENVLDPNIDTSLDSIKEYMHVEFKAERPLVNTNNYTNPYNHDLVTAVHKILVDFNIIQQPST